MMEVTKCLRTNDLAQKILEFATAVPTERDPEYGVGCIELGLDIFCPMARCIPILIDVQNEPLGREEFGSMAWDVKVDMNQQRVADKRYVSKLRLRLTRRDLYARMRVHDLLDKVLPFQQCGGLSLLDGALAVPLVFPRDDMTGLIMIVHDNPLYQKSEANLRIAMTVLRSLLLLGKYKHPEDVIADWTSVQKELLRMTERDSPEWMTLMAQALVSDKYD